jgi:uncharacterized protein YbaP (TraB family)
MTEARRQELSALLDEVGYELTSARAAGLNRPDELRSALKRARTLIVGAEALVADAVATAKKSEDRPSS